MTAIFSFLTSHAPSEDQVSRYIDQKKVAKGIVITSLALLAISLVGALVCVGAAIYTGKVLFLCGALVFIALNISILVAIRKLFRHERAVEPFDAGDGI